MIVIIISSHMINDHLPQINSLPNCVISSHIIIITTHDHRPTNLASSPPNRAYFTYEDVIKKGEDGRPNFLGRKSCKYLQVGPPQNLLRTPKALGNRMKSTL